MRRNEEIGAGDHHSARGNSPHQEEARETVFEDGQIRDTTGEVRPVKDGEEYVYGDSRPDRTESSDSFVDVSESPMMNTTRENLPEVEKPSQALLDATSEGQDDEIRPQYNKTDDTEGQVIVHKEA